MIALTSRAFRSLVLLLEANRPMSVKELSRLAGVSERSTRYDLEIIEMWLREQGLRLLRKPRIGIWLEGSRETQSGVMAKIIAEQQVKDNRFSFVATADDRVQLIMGYALASSATVTVSSLAYVLGVSERTIYYDLNRVRERLKAKGLRLSCHERKLSIHGKEAQCREIVIDFLEKWEKLLETKSHPVFITEAAYPGVQNARDSFRHISESHLLEINSILSDVEPAFDICLGPNALKALGPPILAVVLRVKQGCHIDETQDQLSRLRGRSEWRVASWIARRLEGTFNITLPAPEVGFIALYLAKYVARSRLDKADSKDNYRGLLLSHEGTDSFVCALVEKVQMQLDVDLLQDRDLQVGLVAHLYASLEKIRAGLSISNSFLDEIRARYPIIYSTTSKSIRETEGLAGLQMPEEEIGWIALHIGAALERIAQRKRHWKGIIVCASGVGTAQMLKARVVSQFPCAQLKVRQLMNEELLWQEAQDLGADIIISTVHVGDGPIPAVTVSPFLTSEEAKSIANVIENKTGPSELDLLKSCRVKASPHLTDTSSGNKKGPSLGELVQEDLVRVGINAANATEAITIAGELLREKGIVTTEYVQAMVDLYHQLGPYTLIAPGVALPHASPESGALKLGFAIVSLNEPIFFGCPENDPVATVISFASPDHSSHLQVLLTLFQALHSGLAVRLRGAHTVDDIIQAILQIA